MQSNKPYRQILAYNIALVFVLGSCASSDSEPTSPPPVPVTVAPPPPPPPPPPPAYPNISPDDLPEEFYVQQIDPDYIEPASGTEYSSEYSYQRPPRSTRRTWNDFNQVANDGEGAEGMEPTALESGDVIEPCFIGDRPYGRKLRSLCDNYNKQWNDLAQGRYKLDAPTTMYLGDKINIRLAISAKAASEAEAEEPEMRIEGDRQIIEQDIKIGGQMFAYLESETGAFKINPEGKVFRDTDADITPSWSWEITAQKAGNHKIRARIGYKLTDKDGGNELLIPADDKEIEVKTTFGQDWSNFWAQADDFIKTPTGAIGSLTALLAALFGLWTAFKKFRAKKEGAVQPSDDG